MFMRWLQYICSLKWGMNILLLNEFNDTPYGSMLLKSNGITTEDTWIYVVVLLGIFVGFRILAMIALNRKAIRTGYIYITPARRIFGAAPRLQTRSWTNKWLALGW